MVLAFLSLPNHIPIKYMDRIKKTDQITHVYQFDIVEVLSQLTKYNKPKGSWNKLVGNIRTHWKQSHMFFMCEFLTLVASNKTKNLLSFDDQELTNVLKFMNIVTIQQSRNPL